MTHRPILNSMLQPKRRAARKLRAEAKTRVGEKHLDRVEALIRECCTEAPDDVDKAKELFTKRFKEEFGWITEAILFLNLFLAVLELLKHYGYLQPTQEQYNSIFESV